MTHDAFISYPSKDKAISDEVCAGLEQRGIRCWIAPRDIPAGQNFARSIINAVDASKVFVLVWSLNTNDSEHILNEINQAFDQRIPIIPFRIEEVQLTPEMRYYFGRTHWLDALTPPLDKHIDELAAAIHAALGTTPAVPPPETVRIEPVQEEKVEARPPVRVEEKPSTAHEAPKPAAEEVSTALSPAAAVKKEPVRETRKRETPKLEPEPPRTAKVEPQAVRKPASEVTPVDKKEESRTPTAFPARRKILIPAAVGVLLVAALVLMWSMGVFKGTPSAEQSGSTTPATSAATATLPPATNTTIPATPTPYPSWVGEFSEPILATINVREPDFEDQFTYLKPDWGLEDHRDNPECPNTFSGISGGGLRLQADGNTGDGCWTWANLPQLDLRNFAARMDVNLKELHSSGQVIILGSEEGDSFGFTLTNSGEWNLDFCPSGGNCFQRSGSTSFDPGTPVTITVISYGNEIAYYLGDIPLYHYDHTGMGKLVMPIHFNLSAQSYNPFSNTVEFDNVKIWDLDKAGVFLNGVFTPHPAWVTEFSEPILAAIKDQSPIFEDDFSYQKLSWLLEDSWKTECPNTSSAISDGRLHMQVDNYRGTSCFTRASLPQLDLHNFVARLDLNPQGSTLYTLSLVFADESNESIAFDITWNGMWNVQFCGEYSCIRPESGEVPPYSNNPVTITAIVYGSTYAFFVDNIPIFYINDARTWSTRPVHLSIDANENDTTNPIDEWNIDNLKIWNLDRVENLPTPAP